MAAYYYCCLLVVVVCVVAIDHSLAVTPVSCPAVCVVKNFNLPAYLGRWYEVQRYPVPFQMFGACVTATYTIKPGEQTVTVFNRQINDNTSKVESALGVARLATTNGEAKLLVAFPTSPAPGNYWVLDTDYTNFAIVYSCAVVQGKLMEASWVLSRRPTLSVAGRVRIDTALRNSGINTSKYKLTRQGQSCKYE